MTRISDRTLPVKQWYFPSTISTGENTEMF